MSDMTENELRIGNWVNHPNDGNMEVHGASFLKVFGENVSDMYQPIPLTEEWLVKFGFEEDFEGISSTWHNEVKSIRIEIIHDSNGFHTIVGAFSTWVNIQYVHQLQNLYFALTNTELELKSK